MAERDDLSAARAALQEKARSLQVTMGQQEVHARNAAKNASLEAQELRAQVVHLRASASMRASGAGSQ